MNRLIASGLALALSTSAALAQAAAPGAPPPPPMGLRGPPPGMPGAMIDDGQGGPPPPGGMRGMRPPPHAPSKAAHLHIEHGDTALDIKCPEDEPLKACADLTLQLLDKLQTLPMAAKP